MVTIGFKLQPNPRRNRPWKAKYIQQNASTDNARLQWRSLSHVVLKQNIHHFFCVAKFIYNLKQIVLKSGKALFQCFHVTVLQYYIPMKEVNHFLNNITLIQPNSSTKATLLSRERQPWSLRMWQFRNCKKTKFKRYRTCVVLCKSHKQLDNKIIVFCFPAHTTKKSSRQALVAPWWGGYHIYIYILYANGNAYQLVWRNLALFVSQSTKATVQAIGSRRISFLVRAPRWQAT